MEEQEVNANRPNHITAFQMNTITTLKVWRIKELTYITEENSEVPR